MASGDDLVFEPASAHPPQLIATPDSRQNAVPENMNIDVPDSRPDLCTDVAAFGAAPALDSRKLEVVVYHNDALAPETLFAIFDILDLESLQKVSLACKTWKRIADDDKLWTKFVEPELFSIRRVAAQLMSRCQALIADCVKSVKERLEFLAQTSKLLYEYAGSQHHKNFWQLYPDTKFTHRILRSTSLELCSTDVILRKIEAGEMAVTAKFDIFDLALRRYHEELTEMLPLAHLPGSTRKSTSKEEDAAAAYRADDQTPRAAEVIPASRPMHADMLGLPTGPPDLKAKRARMRTLGNERYPDSLWTEDLCDPRLSVIRDMEARNIWRQEIGPTCWCSWHTFQKMITSALPRPKPENADRFLRHLEHVMNFPCNNTITTFRFDAIVSTFGPFYDITTNFEHYALGQGFAGLTNMIEAEEILRMLKPDVPTVLARFSRQRAACLSFTSYNVANNTLEHRRNTRDDGTMRSMAQVLKEVFPGYLLAEVRVDDAAARAITTAKYVTSSKHQYVTCGQACKSRAGGEEERRGPPPGKQ